MRARRSRGTGGQIAFALRQAEGGTPVADVCRQMDVSEASVYVWKTKYGKHGLTAIREIACARPRFGYRRIHVMLRREGWAWRRGGRRPGSKAVTAA